MAVETPPTLRVVAAAPGVRRDSERVVLPTTAALAPCLEGVALADDGIAAANRIVLAATTGSRAAVIHEAQRLGYRATEARFAFQRMAGLIEDPRPEKAA